MTPERFHIIGEVYDQALVLPPEEREAWLTEACAGDEALRREVESLLAAHDSAGDFIDQPAVEIAANLFPTQAQESIEGKTLGSYQVLSMLGKGGMGEVYLAHDLKLGRKVALKVLPPQFIQDPMRVKLFEREARAASALNHPNIITIFDIGQFEGAHFIATEYVDGQTLRQQLKASARSLREALDIAIQTAGALAAAHEAGIVHRDIKPENVMIRRDGYVKVLDFGLAKLTETAAVTSVNPEALTKQTAYTLPGMVMGTVSYMSPEQARGETVDGRSDIFSLGVLIYEMVTGKTPFAGATPIEVLAATLERDPAPLADSARGIPAELERIVAKALRKDRGKRYQTIRDMLLDLETLKQQFALGATAPARPFRKKRRLLAAAAASLLAVACITALFIRNPIRTAEAPNNARGTTGEEAPERMLAYHIIAQKDPKRFPGNAPFRLAREMVFEAWYQVRLMISTAQAGYLYVLNEGPADSAGNLTNYVILFPDADTSNWSAAIGANRTVQCPQPGENPAEDWFVLDKEEGEEKLILVWAEKAVPELETAKHRANPTHLGAIDDPDQIVAISQFLARHSANKPEITLDQEQKQTMMKTKGEVLIATIRLEHH